MNILQVMLTGENRQASSERSGPMGESHILLMLGVSPEYLLENSPNETHLGFDG